MTKTPATWAAAALFAAILLSVGPANGQTGGQAGEVMPGLTADQVLAKVKAAGYTDIHAVEFEHGRYEVQARGANGREMLLLVNPETGNIRSRPAPQSGATKGTVSIEVVAGKVRDAGFRNVLLIEREHSLYEIHAEDSQGRRVEIFANPKTGELLKHPKTGKLLWKEVEEDLPLGRILTIEEIIALVKKAGYPTVHGIAHKNTIYEVHAHDKQGRMVLLLLDPKTGEVLLHQ